MVDGHSESGGSAARVVTGVDALVGQRVRERRRELGVSRVAMAERLGLTQQQLQKYESGFNRLSAGRLYEIAIMLDVPLSYFYKHCGRLPGGLGEELELLLATEGSLDLCKAFLKLPAARRRTLIEVAQALAVTVPSYEQLEGTP